MFSILTSKLFGGAAIALLLFSGVQTARLHFAHNTIERRDATIKGLNADIVLYKANEAALNATISRQNAVVDAMKATGDAATARASKALREAQRANTKVDEAIGQIRGRKVEGCETGGAIISSGL